MCSTKDWMDVYVYTGENMIRKIPMPCQAVQSNVRIVEFKQKIIKLNLSLLKTKLQEIRHTVKMINWVAIFRADDIKINCFEVTNRIRDYKINQILRHQ